MSLVIQINDHFLRVTETSSLLSYSVVPRLSPATWWLTKEVGGEPPTRKSDKRDAIKKMGFGRNIVAVGSRKAICTALFAKQVCSIFSRFINKCLSFSPGER
uniref:Uncharacterized protein n=1 Tax=Trichuris muris TaxID=70415 RepID=A0A5S6QH42_TRIMR